MSHKAYNLVVACPQTDNYVVEADQLESIYQAVLDAPVGAVCDLVTLEPLTGGLPVAHADMRDHEVKAAARAWRDPGQILRGPESLSRRLGATV